MIVFFCLLSLFSTTAAHADAWDDLQKIYSPEIKGHTLIIKGRIDSHIYDYLSLEAEAIKKVDTIELNSLGGHASWALEIAKKIKSLGKKTLIPEGHFCASACVYLFAAGKERLASKTTWLGIHGARLGAGYTTNFQGLCFIDKESGPVFEPDLKGCKAFLDQWYEVAMKLTTDAFSLMEENGVSPELQKTYFSMPDDPNWPEQLNVIRKPDWVLAAPDAVKFNLVTGLVD